MAVPENRVVKAASCVILLLGISLFMTGMILSDPSQDLAVLLDSAVPPFFVVGVMTLGLSLLSLMTACVGIFGGARHNTCCLVLFILFITLSAALQALTFAFAFRYSSSLKASVMSGLRGAMPLYEPDTNETTEFTRRWDFEQTKHECCGVEAFSDWEEHGSFPHLEWPESCGEYPEDVTPPRGCLSYLVENPYVALILAAVAALALYIPEILGLMSARHALQSIRRRRHFRKMSRSTDAETYYPKMTN